MPKRAAFIARLLLLLAFCRLLLACQTASTPAPTPTVLPVPTATATVVRLAATATPAPTPLPTTPPNVTKLVAVQDRLALTLPATWQTLAVDADGLQASLAALQQANSLVDPTAVDRLRAAVDPQSTALVAWVDAATSLLVTVIPRHELRLESYLTRAQQSLTQQPGVTVHAAQVDVTLREDGLPVGLLYYTLPPGQSGEATAGWQIVLLDQTAEHLVFLTFSTPAGQFPDDLPAFQAVVRSLQWM